MDFTDIKKHIEDARNENKKKREALGEATGVPVASDNFLHELRKSVVTGQPNNVSQKVAAVNEMTMVKSGEKAEANPNVINAAVNNPAPVPQAPQVQAPQMPPQQYAPQKPAYLNEHGIPVDEYGRPVGMPAQPQVGTPQDFDAQFSAEIARKQKEMELVRSKYYGGNPPPMTEQQVPQQAGARDLITERVEQKFDDFLSHQFGQILAEAEKNSILETYKRERVKDVLVENKDIIKTLVVEVIKELQSKKKTTTK